MLLLMVLVVAGSSAIAGKGIQEKTDPAKVLAQRYATEFSIAQAAGADFSELLGPRNAVELLTKGVNGTGPYAGLLFKVSGASPEMVAGAVKLLSFERGILRYQPPIPYHAAWTTGVGSKLQKSNTQSLSHLLAERTAQSFVRVYGSARSAAASLTDVYDVDSAMRVLENGVSGSGSHKGTRFAVAATRPDLRMRAKGMLIFEDGFLHFVPDGRNTEPSEIEAILRRSRSDALAQKIAAVYDAARGAGADFGAASRPDEIVTKLRHGVRASSDLGVQLFRISADASESDWQRSAAYLRMIDGTLTYTPPS